jgi:hypothetical protein
MAEYRIGREDVMAVLRDSLEPLDFVQAMWEAGAASFGRVDEWSDIDLQVASDDERVEDVFEVVERALESLSPIDAMYRLPEPTWHGHSQAFYRLEEASPFLLLDFVVLKASAEDKFLQPEIHSRPSVVFDKSGVVRYDDFDAEAFAGRLRARLAELKALFDLFHILVLKEVNRGNDIEALAFYQSYTLRPLVQVLRMLHDPTRHNFHTRYVHYDMPREAVERLRRLYYVADVSELPAKQKDAECWFAEIVSEIGDGPFMEEIAAHAARTAGGKADA